KYRKVSDYPFTISTDLYQKNYDKPVGSLMQTMSKLLALGYTLEEVVLSVTKRAAESLHLDGYGTLRPGNVANITVFEVQNGTYELFDSQGEVLSVSQLLTPY